MRQRVSLIQINGSLELPHRPLQIAAVSQRDAQVHAGLSRIRFEIAYPPQRRARFAGPARPRQNLSQRGQRTSVIRRKPDSLAYLPFGLDQFPLSGKRETTL